MYGRRAEARAFRRALVVVVAALAAVIVTVGAHSAARAAPTLYVKYGGSSCTFTLTDDSGQSVGSIAPGTYQVLVSTPVVFNDVDPQTYTSLTGCTTYVRFQLDGPGVSLKTSLTAGDEDQASLSAAFQPGSTYIAVDINNPAARIVFTTTAAATAAGAGAGTTTTSTPGSTQPSLVGSAAVRAQGTLQATVHPGGKLTLTRAGAKISSLPAGRWTLVVHDQSAKNGLSLAKTFGTPETITSAVFVGSRTTTLTLGLGRWRLSSTPGKNVIVLVVSAHG
jgi:hypothetical protein